MGSFRRIGWLAVPFGALLAGRAAADPVLLYHIVPASFSACESLNESSLQCSNVTVSSSASQDLFVWIVVADINEVGGIQFGVEYGGGVSIAAWTLCTGGSQIPEEGRWPASGSGNAITWTQGCWNGSGNLAKVGFFYVRTGSSGTMSFIPDPRNNELKWAECGETDPALYDFCTRNGEASLGASGGVLPNGCVCTVGFVEERSWGTIKSTYQDP